MEKNIEQLLEKIKNGSATPEETLALLKTLNISFDILRVALEEIKAEQEKQNLAIQK